MLNTTRSTKIQTPDGRMATITARNAKVVTNANGNDAMCSARRAMAFFYYPLLESCTYILASLNTSLTQAGMFRQTNKFYYKRVDKILSRLMNDVGDLFNSREYFQEFSDAMWEDAEPNLKRLDYATYLAIGRIRKGKDIQVLARLLMLNQIAAHSRDVFHHIFTSTEKKTGLGIEDFFDNFSPRPLLEVLTMWLTTFNGASEAVIELRKNAATTNGFNAFIMMFNDERNISKWGRVAYENIPETLQYAWRPASVRPHGNRRIVIMAHDRTESYLFRYGKIWDADGHGQPWDDDVNMAWRYEKEQPVEYDDFLEEETI